MLSPRVLLTTIAVLLVGASGASAATVSMTSHGLVADFSADGSSNDTILVEANAVTPTGEISQWRVTDGECGAPDFQACMSPGPGCQFPPIGQGGDLLNGRVVTCNRTTAGVTFLTGGGNDTIDPRIGHDNLTADLGDGNDKLLSQTGTGFPGPTSTGFWHVTGGAGNDTIAGSTAGNVVDAGPGDDVVKTFPIDHDILVSSRLTVLHESFFDRPDLSANDSVTGGSGNDYIDMGNGSDSASGGDGDDTFKAGADGDLLSSDAYDGGPNFDTIDYSQRTTPIFFDSGSTQSGADTTSPHELDRDSAIEHVLLGSGNDTALSLFDTASRRTFEGGLGDDVLNGLDSNDTLIGGPGFDHLTGFGGNDTLDAVDGIADAPVGCGAGTDIAKLDLHDPSPADASSCETITREAVKEAPTVRIVAAQRTHAGVAVNLFCPHDDDRSCTGRLDAGATPVSYSIARGHGALVTLGAVHAAKIRVRSVEHGLLGLKTVIRSLRVG
jgi:hypothetical protein